MKNFIFYVSFLLVIPSSIAQKSNIYKKSDTLNKKRRNAVIISESILAGGALIALN
jgi:hypothetical protein